MVGAQQGPARTERSARLGPSGTSRPWAKRGRGRAHAEQRRRRPGSRSAPSATNTRASGSRASSPVEERTAGVPLLRGGPVRRRRAAHRRRHVGPGQAQPVAPGARSSGWLASPARCSARKSQSPDRSPVNIRPVRLAPWAAGARPDHHHGGRRITETGHRCAPVDLVADRRPVWSGPPPRARRPGGGSDGSSPRRPVTPLGSPSCLRPSAPNASPDPAHAHAGSTARCRGGHLNPVSRWAPAPTARMPASRTAQGQPPGRGNGASGAQPPEQLGWWPHGRTLHRREDRTPRGPQTDAHPAGPPRQDPHHRHLATRPGQGSAPVPRGIEAGGGGGQAHRAAAATSPRSTPRPWNAPGRPRHRSPRRWALRVKQSNQACSSATSARGPGRELKELFKLPEWTHGAALPLRVSASPTASRSPRCSCAS